MLAQAATGDQRARKKNFDRVQEILHEQMPGDLSAASECAVGGFASRSPARSRRAFFPHTFWDVEGLTMTAKK